MCFHFLCLKVYLMCYIQRCKFKITSCFFKRKCFSEAYIKKTCILNMTSCFFFCKKPHDFSDRKSKSFCSKIVNVAFKKKKVVLKLIFVGGSHPTPSHGGQQRQGSTETAYPTEFDEFKFFSTLLTSTLSVFFFTKALNE